MAFLNHPASCDCPVCQNYQPYQPSEPEGKDWQAEYQFWTKIIGDEVARLRWNEGFEPLEANLYELKEGRQTKYIGKVRICGRDFKCTAHEAKDESGKKILKLSIRVQPRQH